MRHEHKAWLDHPPWWAAPARRPPIRSALVVACLLVALVLGHAWGRVQAQAAATLTVTSAADLPDTVRDGVCQTSSGGCTLRAAIQEANHRAGADTIQFAIGTGLQTIYLRSALPAIDSSAALTIDGYSQPGAAPNTDPVVSNAHIRIQVTAAADPTLDPTSLTGFVLTSADNVVQGLAVYNLGTNIRITGAGATRNRVLGNFIGTDAAGQYQDAFCHNCRAGVVIDAGATATTIGGTAVADRNVISGNGFHGIRINPIGPADTPAPTHGTVIINNIVGLSPPGTNALPNGKHGIDINSGAAYTVVGGTTPGTRNVISGNADTGVEISHTDPHDNQVLGNYIGTDPTGTSAPLWSRNGGHGVQLEDRTYNNLVAYNVIGNNGGNGVNLEAPLLPTPHDNVVRDNWIGVSPTQVAIGNLGAGIALADGAYRNQLGPNNTIAHNGVVAVPRAGVEVQGTGTRANTITRNSIRVNTGLGIDHAPVGQVNAPDQDAADLLNVPMLDVTTTSTTARGSACVGCRVELFETWGGVGAYGEGPRFVASGVTNADGTFAISITGVRTGDQLTATATDTSGTTSEFAKNVAVP